MKINFIKKINTNIKIYATDKLVYEKYKKKRLRILIFSKNLKKFIKNNNKSNKQ